MLSERNENRGPDSAIVTNTALAVAHVVVIFLILLGNLGMLMAAKKSRPAGGGGA
jgi:hypothetical protein